MMDVYSMTPEELAAEAARRAECKRLGKSYSEPAAEAQQRLQEEDDRIEKEIQDECRKLYIAFGCIVYNLSQVRASKISAGVPDLLVMHRRIGVSFWHELKTPRGVQSPAQKYFEDCARVCRVPYLLGGVKTAEDHLVSIGAAFRVNGSLEPRR